MALPPPPFAPAARPPELENDGRDARPSPFPRRFLAWSYRGDGKHRRLVAHHMLTVLSIEHETAMPVARRLVHAGYWSKDPSHKTLQTGQTPPHSMHKAPSNRKNCSEVRGFRRPRRGCPETRSRFPFGLKKLCAFRVCGVCKVA